MPPISQDYWSTEETTQPKLLEQGWARGCIIIFILPADPYSLCGLPSRAHIHPVSQGLTHLSFWHTRAQQMFGRRDENPVALHLRRNTRRNYRPVTASGRRASPTLSDFKPVKRSISPKSLLLWSHLLPDPTQTENIPYSREEKRGGPGSHLSPLCNPGSSLPPWL